jgi:hypothetical protein
MTRITLFNRWNMKQTIDTMILFCLLALGAFAQVTHAQTVANESENITALRRQFESELRKLRLELLQQSLEFQQWKIKQLERDAQQAALEQQRLLHEENSLQQALAELLQQLSNLPTAGSGQTGELEAMKVELNDRELPRLRAMRPAIDQRVSELTDALRREEIRQRDLQKQANRLKSEQ